MRTGNEKFGVVGAGYVGLPLAVHLAEAGYSVVVVDTDETAVCSLNRGESYIRDVDSSRLKELVDAGRIVAQTDCGGLGECRAISICVPTPLDGMGSPDMSAVASACRAVASELQPGQVVILESTVYTGATRELTVEILEPLSGLKVGDDLFVCFSPERVDPGSVGRSTAETPKLIGGLTARCLDAGYAAYLPVGMPLVSVTSPEVAETAKLFENVYRAVNIALVNEFARLAPTLGVSPHEALDAAGTKPFGFTRFSPGAGVGGHCIPVDHGYLQYALSRRGERFRLAELAAELNDAQPSWVVGEVMRRMVAKGKHPSTGYALVLGMAYKPHIDDVRNSPGVAIAERLREARMRVSYHDPYVDRVTVRGTELESVEPTPERLSSVDVVVIATAHDEFADIDLTGCDVVDPGGTRR